MEYLHEHRTDTIRYHYYKEYQRTGVVLNLRNNVPKKDPWKLLLPMGTPSRPSLRKKHVASLLLLCLTE